MLEKKLPLKKSYSSNSLKMLWLLPSLELIRPEALADFPVFLVSSSINEAQETSKIKEEIVINFFIMAISILCGDAKPEPRPPTNYSDFAVLSFSSSSKSSFVASCDLLMFSRPNFDLAKRASKVFWLFSKNLL